MLHWRIYTVPGSGNYIPKPDTVKVAQNKVDELVLPPNEVATVDSACAQLDAALKDLPPGRYFIQMTASKADTAGGIFAFMDHGAPPVEGMGRAGQMGDIDQMKKLVAELTDTRVAAMYKEFEQKQAALEAERHKKELEQRIKELEDTNKELRGIEGPVNIIVEALINKGAMKLMPLISPGGTPLAEAVAGTQAQEPPIDIDDTRAQAADALQNIADKIGDEKLAATLAKLASMDAATLDNLTSMI